MITLAEFSAVVIKQAKELLPVCESQLKNPDKKLALIAYEQIQTLRELIHLFSAENFKEEAALDFENIKPFLDLLAQRNKTIQKIPYFCGDYPLNRILFAAAKLISAVLNPTAKSTDWVFLIIPTLNRNHEFDGAKFESGALILADNYLIDPQHCIDAIWRNANSTSNELAVLHPFTNAPLLPIPYSQVVAFANRQDLPKERYHQFFLKHLGKRIYTTNQLVELVAFCEHAEQFAELCTCGFLLDILEQLKTVETFKALYNQFPSDSSFDKEMRIAIIHYYYPVQHVADFYAVLQCLQSDDIDEFLKRSQEVRSTLFKKPADILPALTDKTFHYFAPHFSALFSDLAAYYAINKGWREKRTVASIETEIAYYCLPKLARFITRSEDYINVLSEITHPKAVQGLHWELKHSLPERVKEYNEATPGQRLAIEDLLKALNETMAKLATTEDELLFDKEIFVDLMQDKYLPFLGMLVKVFRQEIYNNLPYEKLIHFSNHCSPAAAKELIEHYPIYSGNQLIDFLNYFPDSCAFLLLKYSERLPLLYRNEQERRAFLVATRNIYPLLVAKYIPRCVTVWCRSVYDLYVYTATLSHAQTQIVFDAIKSNILTQLESGWDLYYLISALQDEAHPLSQAMLDEWMPNWRQVLSLEIFLKLIFGNSAQWQRHLLELVKDKLAFFAERKSDFKKIVENLSSESLLFFLQELAKNKVLQQHITGKNDLNWLMPQAGDSKACLSFLGEFLAKHNPQLAQQCPIVTLPGLQAEVSVAVTGVFSQKSASQTFVQVSRGNSMTRDQTN